MAVLSVQNATLAGTQHTYAAVAAGGDSFPNDGNTILLFKNGNASPRTLTIASAAASVNKPGFGDIALSNPTATIPGSGTNGGEVMVGPFPVDRFNDPSTGRVGLTYSTDTGVTVAVIRLPRA